MGDESLKSKVLSPLVNFRSNEQLIIRVFSRLLSCKGRVAPSIQSGILSDAGGGVSISAGVMKA